MTFNKCQQTVDFKKIKQFKNIEITPHNLRNDTLQEGVITAMDVIMTLGDLGLISYGLMIGIIIFVLLI